MSEHQNFQSQTDDTHPSAPQPESNTETRTIPVYEETIEVGKRMVEHEAVNVRKAVDTIEEMVELPLRKETIEVHRVPINRPIESPVSSRYETMYEENDTLVVPVLEEVLVVTKQLRLKEEVHITRRRHIEQHQQEVPVRRERVEITQGESH